MKTKMMLLAAAMMMTLSMSAKDAVKKETVRKGDAVEMRADARRGDLHKKDFRDERAFREMPRKDGARREMMKRKDFRRCDGRVAGKGDCKKELRMKK